MGTFTPEERQERLEEHAGFAFKVISYRLGDVWHATAYNLDPGAAIARAEGDSREAAESQVIDTACRRLGRTRTFE